MLVVGTRVAVVVVVSGAGSDIVVVVEPDVVVEDVLRFGNGADPQLEKALDIAFE